jgi:hypothetical protein
MENKSVFLPSFTYGLIIAVVLIVFKLILYLLDIDEQSYWQMFYYVIFAFGIVWVEFFMRNQRLDGYITFGKAFLVGFYASLAVALVMAVYSYVYMSYINPGMIDEILSKTEEQIIEKNPDISDEDLSTALDMTVTFMKPGMMAAMSMLGTLITGALLSLVAAVFVKRKAVEIEV